MLIEQSKGQKNTPVEKFLKDNKLEALIPLANQLQLKNIHDFKGLDEQQIRVHMGKDNLEASELLIKSLA